MSNCFDVHMAELERKEASCDSPYRKRVVPNMPNIPPPPPKRQPNDLQHAQHWFCGWTRAVFVGPRLIRATGRLYAAIRAQAQKGHTEP